MQILINDSHIEVAQNGKVDGIIYIRDGEFVFPSERWVDYILLHLEWWTKSFEDIVVNKKNNSRFDFFDGPFYWEITRKEKFTVSFYDRYKLVHQIEKDDISDMVDKFIISSRHYCKNALEILLTQPVGRSEYFQEGLEESIEICKRVSTIDRIV